MSYPRDYRPTMAEQDERARDLMSKPLDVHGFAAELATALGGKVEPPSDPANVPWYASIDLPSGLRLSVQRARNGGGKKFRVSSGGPRPWHEIVNRHSRAPEFPEATVDSSRPMRNIAADIARRVVNAAAIPLAALEQLANEVNARKQTMAATAAEWRAAFPGLQVNLKDGETEAGLYLNKDGTYFTGRLSPSGDVYVERIGSLSADKARKVLAALLS